MRAAPVSKIFLLAVAAAYLCHRGDVLWCGARGIPLGTFFRYIGDSGTYIARYDDLVTGREEPIDVSKVDVSMNGIELQDREFIAAIREGRQPNSSVSDVLDCYRVIGELAASLEAQDGWS